MKKNIVNYRQLLTIVVISLSLLIVCFNILDYAFKKYTKHNQIIYVPSLIGLDLKTCQDTLFDLGLYCIVLDSAAYDPNFIRGGVITHDPKPNSVVKPGRKVYLTINPIKIDFIKVPILKDKSFRQASATLENSALRVGQLFYLDDFARDVVKFTSFNNERISVNDTFPKFTLIDLHLGNGYQELVEVPDLKGVVYSQLKAKLNNHSLNVGSCFFQDTLEDTLNAVVYDFEPNYKDFVELGASISVWLSDSLSEDQIK